VLRVAGTHTQTQRGKDSQDIGTPTHRLRFHLVLHFTSLQFSSVHSIFPVLADWPLELRAYINADRQGTPDPRKPPWIAPKPPWIPQKDPPLWTLSPLCTSCCQFVCQITNAPQSQTKIWTGPCRSCQSPNPHRKSPGPRPCTPYHCHDRHLINQSINSRFFFISLNFAFSGLCVIFIIIFIFFFFFIILICLSLNRECHSFCLFMPLFVYAF